MDALVKAVWYIESNFVREIDLDEIASAAGVSRFHLTRAFGQSFGRSAIRYMRGRRLSEAAKKLADGAPDILSVALDAGYASHEAFTRAFREQFGTTPEQFRAMPDKTPIDLVEAILVDQQSAVTLAEPRIVDADEMFFVGIGERFEYDQMGGIPALWQRFNQHVGSIQGEVPGAAYGICTNADAGGLDYICAVEVKDFSDVDRELTRLRVPAQRYAVFAHGGPIVEIRTVIRAIWGEWLPSSPHESADGPSFERYGKGFDPVTGDGGFEIWVPIKN
jgi:AraC family transcriptional regulator